MQMRINKQKQMPLRHERQNNLIVSAMHLHGTVQKSQQPGEWYIC